jgi:hypothetical protein
VENDMPSPDFTYADNLQNRSRWGPQGLSFTSRGIDEFCLALPRVVRPGLGETLTTASLVDGFDPSSLAGFAPAGTPPVEGFPANQGTDWRLFQITALATVDVVRNRANQQPNDLHEEVLRQRRTALLQVMAPALANGDGTNQWLGFTAPTFPKTVIDVPPDPSPQGVLATLKLLDDACTTHELGRRATVFVTSERGRRNCEAAQEAMGLRVVYEMIQGVAQPVATYRGLRIIVSSGMTDDLVANTAPVYAVDFTQTFFLATSGTVETWCIGEEPLHFQESGSIGRLLYVHGAPIALTNRAYIAGSITTSLSL